MVWQWFIAYLHAKILRLGWDTMSSTSSGLFCKMAAASLNVTPSKLVLFREMRRPPWKNKKQNNGQINLKKCAAMFCLCVISSVSCLLLPLLTGFDSSISVCRSIRHNGSNKDPKVEFTCIVLSHYYKAWNRTREEDKGLTVHCSLILHTSYTVTLSLINSPKPNLGSFFKFTQTISRSGGVLVGVSTAKPIDKTRSRDCRFIYMFSIALKVTETLRLMSNSDRPNHLIYMTLDNYTHRGPCWLDQDKNKDCSHYIVK